MTTVIANTTIVTGNAGRTVLHDAGIAVSEGRIAAVGPTAEVARSHPDAEVVDGRGKAVFPGLVNCHTHLLATGDRGILEDFGFPTRLTFPGSARSLLSAEERQTLALLGALESIRSGATCLLEISSDVAGYAPDLAATGLRLALAENINDVDEAQAREGVTVRRGQGRRRTATERRPGGVLARPAAGAGQLLPGAPRSRDLLAGPAAPKSGDGRRLRCRLYHPPVPEQPGDRSGHARPGRVADPLPVRQRLPGAEPCWPPIAGTSILRRLHCWASAGSRLPTTPPSPPDGARPRRYGSCRELGAPSAWGRTIWPRTWWR